MLADEIEKALGLEDEVQEETDWKCALSLAYTRDHWRQIVAALRLATELVKDVDHPSNPTSCYISLETREALDVYRAAVSP